MKYIGAVRSTYFCLEIVIMYEVSNVTEQTNNESCISLSEQEPEKLWLIFDQVVQNFKCAVEDVDIQKIDVQDLNCELYNISAAIIVTYEKCLQRMHDEIKNGLLDGNDPDVQAQVLHLQQTVKNLIDDNIEFKMPSVNLRNKTIEQIETLIPKILDFTNHAIDNGVSVGYFDELFIEFARIKSRNSSANHETLADVVSDNKKMFKMLNDITDFLHSAKHERDKT